MAEPRSAGRARHLELVPRPPSPLTRYGIGGIAMDSVPVSLATLRAVRECMERLAPMLAAEKAADETSGIPHLGTADAWTFPRNGDGGALEACRWRMDRDAHCGCFRCSSQGADVQAARVRSTACTRPECCWCATVEQWAPATKKVAKKASKKAPAKQRSGLAREPVLHAGPDDDAWLTGEAALRALDAEVPRG